MALAKQISQFRIVANGNTYDISVQNMTSNPGFERYTDDITAIGGKRYINPAGLRDRIEITYDRSIDSTSWRNLINDILTHTITNGNEFLDFYFDATNTDTADKIEVQVEDLGYAVQYANSIGGFSPSITLVARDRKTSIEEEFQAPTFGGIGTMIIESTFIVQ